MDNDDNRERTEASKGSKKIADYLQEFQTIPREYVLGGILPTGLRFGRRLLGRCMTQTCAAHGIFVAVWTWVGMGMLTQWVWVGEVGGQNVDFPSTCRLAHMLDATEHHGYVKGLGRFSGSSESKTCGTVFAAYLSRSPGFEPVLLCLAECWMTLTTCAIHATFMKCHR